jgi:hypothetical protein
MKTQILFSAIAVLTYTGSVLAQPTLSFSGMPTIGTTISSSEVDGTGINPGPAGANQTWNFTSFPDTGVVVNIQFAEAASTPYAAQFPAANTVSVGEANYQGNTVFSYSYSNLTSAGLELIGNLVSYGPGSEFSTSLTNPQTIYSFPASFNSVSTDEFASLAPSFTFPPTPPSDNLITGIASYVVDGYGTLVTSSGSYPNCLRFKRREITSDTIISEVNEGQITTTYNQTRSTSYEWVTIQNNGSYPVWSIAYDTTIATLQFGQAFENYSSSVNHSYGDFPTKLQESNTTKLGLYPNPASQQVMVMLPEDATVTLLDMRGRILQTSHFTLQNQTLPLFDVSHFSSGTYLIKAESERFNALEKLIIAH